MDNTQLVALVREKQTLELKQRKNASFSAQDNARLTELKAILACY